MKATVIGIALALLVSVAFQAFAQSGPVAPIYTLNQGLKAAVVTPNDTTTFLPVTRAVFIGNATACNIAVLMANDTVAVTFLNVQSGQFLPLQVKKVMATNTTCSNIVALY